MLPVMVVTMVFALLGRLRPLLCLHLPIRRRRVPVRIARLVLVLIVRLPSHHHRRLRHRRARAPIVRHVRVLIARHRLIRRRALAPIARRLLTLRRVRARTVRPRQTLHRVRVRIARRLQIRRLFRVPVLTVVLALALSVLLRRLHHARVLNATLGLVHHRAAVIALRRLCRLVIRFWLLSFSSSGLFAAVHRSLILTMMVSPIGRFLLMAITHLRLQLLTT